jgi:hypothetical protein
VYENSFRSNEHEFTTAIRELDAAKALVRKRQLELSDAIPALSCDQPSPDKLLNFEERSRVMHEATELYLHAVGVFNAACLEKPAKIRRARPGFSVTWSS